MKKIIALLLVYVGLSCFGFASAKTHPLYYRNIWNPMYHEQRLNYCSLDGQHCGLAVATRYCHMLGYEKAVKQIKAYNVGFTHIIGSKAQCEGFGCHGFELIQCVGQFSHKPAQNYYYRSMRYPYPRFDHYRVDWCYKKHQGCGQRAANSFCRRLGYKHAQSFKKQEHVAATKKLGTYELCFGTTCSGFQEISCFR